MFSKTCRASTVGIISRKMGITLGLIAVLVLMVSFYVFQEGVDSERKKTEAGKQEAKQTKTDRNEEGDPTEKRRTTGSEENTLVVRKRRPGSYRFTLDVSLPVDVPESTGVTISLWRGSYKIDSGWEVVVGSNQRIRWQATIGTPTNRLPPGLYRVRLSFDEPVMHAPNRLVRTVSRRPGHDSVRERVLSRNAWTIEFGAQIGRRTDIEQFEQTHVRRVKEGGIALVEAWTDWRRAVRKAYKQKRSNATVPEDVADQLLNRLKTVETKSKALLEHPNPDTSYLWTPKPPFSSDLKTFVRTVPAKVNSLTVTMLEQLMGGLPEDWPRKYRISGFQSNIDVFRHMNTYHKRTVKELRSSLENWGARMSAFRSVESYRRYRLRKLLERIDAVEQFYQGTRFQQFKQVLPENSGLKQAILNTFVQYMRKLLRLHVHAYQATVTDMKLQEMIEPDLLPVLEAVLLGTLENVYRELDVSVPETVTERLTSARSTYDLSARLRQLRRSAETREPNREQQNVPSRVQTNEGN